MGDKNKLSNSTDKNFWLAISLKIFAESSLAIAVPVVGALYLGRYLDDRQNTGNLYFLSLTATAFIISCISLARIGLKYMSMLDKDKVGKKEDESK